MADVPLNLAEIEQRIAAVRENISELIEQAAAYSGAADEELAARRIADLVALAFAHERLAEEERRRAEAQERAVQLEGRVARLAAELAFTLLNGDPNSMRLVDQMQHVANHATLHRGQVVGMIRQLGIAPPSTDLLFYLRREIPPN